MLFIVLDFRRGYLLFHWLCCSKAHEKYMLKIIHCMHNTLHHGSKLWQISLFSKSAVFWLSSCLNPSLKCQEIRSPYRRALCEMENTQQAAGPLSVLLPQQNPPSSDQWLRAAGVPMLFPSPLPGLSFSFGMW